MIVLNQNQFNVSDYLINIHMKAQYSPFITNKLPVDSQGFTQSFDINSFDAKEVTDFYNKFGLVIFNNVLSQEEINLSINDLWEEVSDLFQGSIRRQDPKSWHSFRGSLGGYGFVNDKPNSKPQLWKNRSHPNVYNIFKSMHQITSKQTVKEPLICLFDRGSMLRPGKIDQDWKTWDIYHFDIDPWEWTSDQKDLKQSWRRQNEYCPQFEYWLGQGNYVPKVNNFSKLQGVLALSATSPNSGGFQCVCGFQNYIKQWCKLNKPGTMIQQCEQLMNNMQKCYQRPGSILIFNRELPHNIFSNNSENFRYAQYLRIAPESTLMLTPQQKQARKRQVKKMLPSYYDVSNNICRQIYMLE